jgi:nitrite reductase/ring-hydroxylating ferredoxin subunit
MKKKLENRRDFLKKVCPTIAFAFFGLSFLEACSTGDDSDNNDNNDNNNDPLGYSSSGSVFTIDLTHPNFSNLSSVGGWMNGYSIGLSMLFLRISSDHIQAYTNVCPHQGTQNQWSLQSGNIFRCANHNYSFDSTCETSSSLPCYSTNIDGDDLIVAI